MSDIQRAQESWHNERAGGAVEDVCYRCEQADCMRETCRSCDDCGRRFDADNGGMAWDDVCVASCDACLEKSGYYAEMRAAAAYVWARAASPTCASQGFVRCQCGRCLDYCPPF
jgi:hypothetical protein